MELEQREADAAFQYLIQEQQRQSMALLMSAEAPDLPRCELLAHAAEAVVVLEPAVACSVPPVPQQPRDARASLVTGALARLVGLMQQPAQEALLQRVGLGDLCTLEARIGAAADRCFSTVPAWHVRTAAEPSIISDAQQARDEAPELEEGCA